MVNTAHVSVHICICGVEIHFRSHLKSHKTVAIKSDLWPFTAYVQFVSICIMYTDSLSCHAIYSS